MRRRLLYSFVFLLPACQAYVSISHSLLAKRVSGTRSTPVRSQSVRLQCPFRTLEPRRRPRAGKCLLHVSVLPTTEELSVLEKKEKLRHTLKVGSFFFFWYSFNIGYNLYTKWTLNVLPLPWTLALAQVVVGIPYVILLWALGIRKAPRLTIENLKTVSPVALAHTFAHLGAVVSLGAGAVGFVQIVKAAEPLFTAVLSAVIVGNVMPWPVYMTLLPVVGGVALASAQELSFSLTALVAAMCSNSCAATRSVLGKMTMSKEKGENMDAGNLYAVMTIMASFVLLPLAAIAEGRSIPVYWKAALAGGATSRSLLKSIGLSGLFFYLYNEVAFYCLNAIHPVTHGIGNTVKRVVMIMVSVVAFHHKFTPLGMLGSATAIGGVLLYSVIKGHYDAVAKEGRLRDAAAAK